MSIDEITKPAIAKPLGFLNTPINENKNPRNHMITFATGAQHRRIESKANTKPAVPKPLERGACTLTIV
jgi:hypothetical protein